MKKVKVFVSSTIRDLKPERNHLIDLIKKNSDLQYIAKRDFDGGYPIKKCLEEARKADVFILILGNKYGTIEPSSGKSFTQLEYEEFLFTHLGVPDLGKIIKILWKDERSIKNNGRKESEKHKQKLKEFKLQISRRHTYRTKFVILDSMESKIQEYLESVTDIDTSIQYKKLSTKDFNFKIKAESCDISEIETSFSECPCPVHKINGCSFDEKLQFKPTGELFEAYQKYLPKRISESNREFNKEQPSFKVIDIQDSRKKLKLWFCNSKWDHFRGTNLAARKDSTIKKLLDLNQKKYNFELNKSSFSNNLGFTILVSDYYDRTYYSYRSNENVATNEGKIQLAAGTQLHAYDPKHIFKDNTPNLKSAILTELKNETGIGKKDISEIKLLGWGISKEIGNPEFMFMCKLKEGVQLYDDVLKRILNATKEDIPHISEFDRTRMKNDENNCIPEDYLHLRKIALNPTDWEPESAVASMLFYNSVLGDNCTNIE